MDSSFSGTSAVNFSSLIALSIASGSIVKRAKPGKLASQRAEMPSRCSLGSKMAFTRTSTGALKGKIGYMPPEQLQGEELDGRSDQYSLGVVLWELLCRRRLFQDDNPIKVLRAVLERPIPPSSSVVEGVPPVLDQIASRFASLPA